MVCVPIILQIYFMRDSSTDYPWEHGRKNKLNFVGKVIFFEGFEKEYIITFIDF